eukprot:tig00020614_g12195.t1
MSIKSAATAISEAASAAAAVASERIHDVVHAEELDSALTPAQKESDPLLAPEDVTAEAEFILKMCVAKIVEPLDLRRAHFERLPAFHDIVGAVKGKRFGKRSVFASLLACSQCHEKESQEHVLRLVWHARARACELLALRLMDDYDLVDLCSRVLVRTYRYDAGERSSSAIEQVVLLGLLDIVADPRVEACIKEMWHGHVLMASEKDAQLVHRALGALDLSLLRVPQYQYFIETGILLSFILLYTWVINSRSMPLTGQEVCMYLFVLAYVLDDGATAIRRPGMYFLSLWNWFEIVTYAVFAGAFCLRVASLAASEPAERERLMDLSFDVLAVNAVVLWMRVLNVLSNVEFFGALLVILRHMIRDAALFFSIMALVLMGFTQAFHSLYQSTASTVGHASYLEIFSMLFRALTAEAPFFEEAEAANPFFGRLLAAAFGVLALVVLLSLLVALLNRALVQGDRVRQATWADSGRQAARFHPLFGPLLMDLYLVVALVLLLNLLIAQVPSDPVPSDTGAFLIASPLS